MCDDDDVHKEQIENHKIERIEKIIKYIRALKN